MLINDLIALLMKIPPMLAGQWAAWFFLGLILSIWTRREKTRLVVQSHSPKPKSGVRQPARLVTPQVVVHSAGDAFGDLEALFEPQTGTHRPGDEPILGEQSQVPALAGPQSLT